MALHIETPLLASSALSNIAGRTIWLKMDALQPPGSFKIRGIGHACKTYVAQGARHLVASSGGNAGLAVAYAGQRLQVPVTVVVPQTTTARAIELLRLEQADVIVQGASWQEANAYAQSLLGEHDAFIHPFDDPLLWQGHATLVDEVARAGVKPDAVVLCVGGGGLLAGVVAGLQRNQWQDVPVFAVETTGAASFHAAVQAGQTVELAAISSIATSLGAKRVCEQAFLATKIQPIHSVLVTDQQALSACQRFLADHRVLVEPACGASLALVYQHADLLRQFNNVLVVVCGGATATLQQIMATNNDNK